MPDACSCSIPQVTTELLVFSCHAQWHLDDCCGGTGEHLSFTLPTKNSPGRLSDLNQKTFSDRLTLQGGEIVTYLLNLPCIWCKDVN